MAARFYMGIDVGSTASKCVVVDELSEIVGKGLYPSGAGTVGPARSIERALAEAGIVQEEVAGVCATGYGRNLIECEKAGVPVVVIEVDQSTETYEQARTQLETFGELL